MLFDINCTIIKNGLRFIKIIEFNSNLICICSKLHIEKENIKKYIIYSYLLDENFKILEDTEKILNFENIDINYLDDLYISLWIRDLYKDNNNYYLLIDFNKNIDNKYFESNTYLLNTNDFINFTLVKKYEENDILHKEFNNNLFFSKIIKDDTNNWGKYLFEFKIDNKLIQPQFNEFIDYETDIGHLLHNIEYDCVNENYIVIFSILNNDKKYNIYYSKTNDFINYRDTKKIEIKCNNISTEFYCYPFMFKYFNKNFIVVNQDDYGKNTEPIILREYDDSLIFIENKYKISNNISNKLLYNDNKKYIFYNELESKNGNRYTDIIQNNKNINNYSTHSPSCNKLFDLLIKLNITKEDSIIDIGSGKGWALTLFNLFPFNKISGIEISKGDYETSKNNLEILNIKNINIINDDIINFKDYDDYNYFYFYNPFNSIIFENVIKNIKNIKNSNVKIIYNNIHDEEINILKKYNFILINEEKGINRNYYVFSNIPYIIKYTDKINIINNNISKEYINNINKTLLFYEEKVNIKINFDIKLITKVNYNINHMISKFYDVNDLIPTIDIFDNFIKNNENKTFDNDFLYVENGVFFRSFTSCSHYLSHFMFDYIESINIFYELLLNNPNYKIILEFIPHANFNHKWDYNGHNTSNNNIILNKFITFIRDIGLTNDILIISDINIFQNFNNDGIFIKNFYSINLKKINNLDWIPLITRFIKNENGNYFCETIKNIISKKNNINIHYEHYKKKFFILEERNNSSFNQTVRNINNDEFVKFKDICNEYCIKNNLELVIWNSKITNNSIYEQFNICNNAEIIIGFGGSFWLHNYTMTCGKVLILNNIVEYDGKYKILYDMCLYTYNKLFKNNDINNVTLHFYDNNDIFNKSDIIEKFLYL